MIMHGVWIGNHVIVGVLSVVTKDVAPIRLSQGIRSVDE